MKRWPEVLKTTLSRSNKVITGKETSTVKIGGNTNRPLEWSEISPVQDVIKPVAECYFSEQTSDKDVEDKL